MGLPGSFWIMEVAVTHFTYWLTVLLTSVVALMPRYAYSSLYWTRWTRRIYFVRASVSRTNFVTRDLFFLCGSLGYICKLNVHAFLSRFVIAD